jgi:ferrochelatase
LNTQNKPLSKTDVFCYAVIKYACAKTSMKEYLAQKNFSHKKGEKIGVLLVNLGTPQEPTPKALKKYLREFLSDPRVIEVPKIIWFFILNFIVLVFRPKKSAQKYKTIWTPQGSPLLIYCQNLLEKLKKQFSADYVFSLAMSYGEPSVFQSLQTLQEQNCKYLLVIPLYPQYSGSTTGSVFDSISSYFQKARWVPHLHFLHSYHDEPLYISAIAKSIRKARKNKATILFSYHGTPLKYLLQGDPYHCQCHKTTRLVAEKLKLEESEYLTCFQSRFGKDAWLQPYSDKTIEKIAKDKKEIFVICAGFCVDCLETLEEMAEENKEIFFASGGEKYHYIPCLNDEPEQLELFYFLIKKHTGGWSLEKNKPQQEKLYQSLKQKFSFYTT